MGLFEYTVAGGGFILIGAWESLRSKHSSSWVTLVSILVLSVLFILNSLISFAHALSSKDSLGSVLQLQLLAVSLLFLLYSALGLLQRLPPPILNLLSLFAFAQEFLLFYLQRKDPSGVENRYYDLFLVPVAICAFSSIRESHYTRLARGIGCILQGMWILQMGFSFFSDLIAHGCSLHQKSRGNYTIKCKGHPEYHRGGAIATLQFNCHLALLLTLTTLVYSILSKKHAIYTPIGSDMQQHRQPHFTLDFDEDDDDNGIKHVEMQKPIISSINGQHTHP